jgi:hypothetical protein
VRSVESPPPYEFPTEKAVQEKPKPKPETAAKVKTVFFKDIEGRSMNLTDLPISMTIAEVKRKLAAEKSVRNDSTTRFIFGGKPLMDGKFKFKLTRISNTAPVK